MLSSRQPLTNSDGTPASVWFQFFSTVDSLLGGAPSKGGPVPAANESAVTVGASPFTYTAPSNGALLVTGGTVSEIALQRQSSYNLGITTGYIPVAADDEVTITFTGAPTVVFFPT
jgi:hypothetical protein